MVRKTDYILYIEDLLSSFGTIKIKPMFGGYGVYKDQHIIAIIADDEMYFKGDDMYQNQYDACHATQFTYEKKGKNMKMRYWKPPVKVLEDHDELSIWVNQAYVISFDQSCKKA